MEYKIPGLTGLAALQSQNQLELLDEIDKLRAYGIQDFVSLPQLVVCGDQSSGKSSVLEAITEIPFPRKDNLCTRFATEIVLRRAMKRSVVVKIIPGDSRSIKETEALQSFDRKLEEFDDLPRLIEEAADAMGLTDSNNAFSTDVLSVEISGPDRPQLTIVDLPGLIHSENKSQSRSDVEVVARLVESYIKNKRTIILAVITAKNDYANQIILQRARQVDPTGDRTLGIITKPDTLHAGSQSEVAFISLAQNEDSVVQFRLGWHILKNRDYESKDCSFSERNQSESTFFDQGAWSKLPKDIVGIDSLRRRLSALLLDHIRSELPSLCGEVEEHLRSCERELKCIGDERSSSRDQTIFLSKLSQRFLELCKAAVDGLYEDPFFGFVESDLGYGKRLRAVVQNTNAAFAARMRLKGHTKEIVAAKPQDLARTTVKEIPQKVTETEAVEWVKGILLRSRGRELPGTFNPMIINTLFQEQSQQWEVEARKHVEHVWRACYRLMTSIIGEIADHRVGERLIQHWIHDLLKMRLCNAESELKQILADRQEHAITYNHYYTENVQKIHQQRRAKSSQNALKEILGLAENEQVDMTQNLVISPQAFLSSFSSQTEADMDRFACIEILDRVLAYYKVALKTFVDNVTIQVIERRIVARLWEVFTPVSVAAMGSDVVAKIAMESPSEQERRMQLSSRAAKLRKGLDVCKSALGDFHQDQSKDSSISLYQIQSNASDYESDVSAQIAQLNNISTTIVKPLEALEQTAVPGLSWEDFQADAAPESWIKSCGPVSPAIVKKKKMKKVFS